MQAYPQLHHPRADSEISNRRGTIYDLFWSRHSVMIFILSSSETLSLEDLVHVLEPVNVFPILWQEYAVDMHFLFSVDSLCRDGSQFCVPRWPCYICWKFPSDAQHYPFPDEQQNELENRGDYQNKPGKREPAQVVGYGNRCDAEDKNRLKQCNRSFLQCFPVEFQQAENVKINQCRNRNKRRGRDIRFKVECRQRPIVPDKERQNIRTWIKARSTSIIAILVFIAFSN